jgi:hypothetical protein
METNGTEWREFLELLPKGWEEKAKELGALVRGRNIKTTEELFALLMTYIGNDVSMQTTSTIFSLTMGIKLAKSAVFHRIKSSCEWMRWMAKELCENEGMAIPKPEFLGKRSVILVDASDEAVHGSKKSDYRLHYAFDLFQFKSREIELTKAAEGEKLSRYKVMQGDVFIADRTYCTIRGIEHILEGQGEFLLRYRSNAFNLYNEDGEKVDLLSCIRHLNEYESTDIRCFYKLPNHNRRPIRIVVMKKDKAAIEQAKRKMLQKASKQQREAAKVETLELNEYIVLATNLEFTNTQILELYRVRWQIEQVFYRLKSLYNYDEVPCENPETAQAWFYGKILLGALCEKIIKQHVFSPSANWQAALRTSFGS